MSRQEFTRKTMALAFRRCGGRCENPDCGAKLTTGKIEYDHIIACEMGGDNSLENCQVLCTPCHKAKTRVDVGTIAKSNRIRDRHNGIKKPSRFACSRQSGFKRKMDGSVVRR